LTKQLIIEGAAQGLVLARVEGLQIPCMMQWNYCAAEVKHDEW
jgi:hypothetical protein